MMRVSTINWVILLQVIAFISCVLAVADSNHDKRGYISIDCGNPSPVPLDNVTYSSDMGFIDTGFNNRVLPEYEETSSPSYFDTLRSFPDGARNCYTLKPLNGKGNKFLIRAHFMYGNYDRKGKLPQLFYIYIGVNFWDQVYIESEGSVTFKEIIHKLTSDSIDICLVNIGKGTPFISALLLRPLDGSIYTSNLGSLVTFLRYNVGSYSTNNEYFVSDSDDIYDRLWGELNASQWKQFWVPVNTSTQLNLSYINNDKYKIPPRILMTSATPPSKVRSLDITQDLNGYDQQSVYYVCWHFLETHKLGKAEVREFDILVNGNVVESRIHSKYMEALTFVSDDIKVDPGYQFNFSIVQSNASTLPPFLNSLEMYYVLNLPQSPTNQDDVKAMMDIKTNYMHKINSGWQADPCLPFTPWDGLNCSNNDTNSPRIISLNLASRGLTGKILPSLSSLTSLQFLNLSNNQLTGDIPEFLANISSLKVIDLSKNLFNGSVPAKLIQKSNDGLFLSLEGNSGLCISSTCTEKNANHSKVLVPLAASASSLVLLLVVAVAVFCAYKQGYTKTKASVGGMNNSERKQFSYSEVIRITNNFERSIGKGAFGHVYHGHLQNGVEVAVKILNQSNTTLILQSFQTEAELLMRVHHRNLVSLVGYCDEHNTKVLMYEYMDNGDLQQQLSGEQTLSWKERLQISIDAAQGLEYLHNGCKPGIVHRDMKTTNILLDDKLVAKIGDFGLSRIFATESATHISTGVVGTPEYLDPEYHASGKLTEKSDVYSFGVILLELISGRKALGRDDNMNQIYIVSWVAPYLSSGDIRNIVDKRLQGDYNINSIWKALETAIACTSISGSKRPSMNQVVIDLKESLSLELSHKKQNNGGENEPSCSSQNFDGICVADLEVFLGPSAR